MSRIDDLIRDLCPDGVEYRTIGSLGQWRGGGTPSKSRPEFWENGTIPWVSPKDMGSYELTSTQDKITLQATRESSANLVPGPSLAVVSRSSILQHTLPVSIVPFEASFNQDTKTLTPSKNVNLHYTAHALRANADSILATTSKRGGSVNSLILPKFLEYKIPLPPLEIQREIATTLDKFTQHSKELSGLLKREQTLLLTGYNLHKKAVMHSLSLFPVRTINDIATFINGKPHERLTAPNGDMALMTAKFVSRAGIADRYIHSDDAKTPALADDVALVMSDLPGGRALARAFHVPADNRYAANQRVCLLRTIDPSETDPRFLFHIVNRNHQLLNYDNGSDQTHLKRPQIEGVKIPYPPLPIQRQYAKLLDSLDASFEELNSQLSAEIEARRKQYEYYRNRLLTFPEKS